MSMMAICTTMAVKFANTRALRSPFDAFERAVDFGDALGQQEQAA